MNAIYRIVGFIGVLVIAALLVQADTLTIPYKSKSPGDTILASQWNDNFAEIETIVNGTLNSANIANLGVGTAQLANSAVTTGKILDDTIALADMGNNSVDSPEMVTDSVQADELDDETCVIMLTSGAESGGNAISISADNFSGIGIGGAGTPETSYDFFQNPQALQINEMYAEVLNNPGAAASGAARDVTLRDDGADTNATCQIFETATSCSWSGTPFTVAADSAWTIEWTPTSSPAATSRWVVVICASP